MLRVHSMQPMLQAGSPQCVASIHEGGPGLSQQEVVCVGGWVGGCVGVGVGGGGDGETE